MTQPLEQRTGPGRWTPTRSPRGVLWTNDTTAVGFQPGPGESSAVVDMLIAATEGDPTQVFDQLAVQVGTKVLVGDLGTWTPSA